MKQKLLSALIATACAGLATSASAGVIQASYKNFAAEAFGADIAMIAPTIGYSLALPLTGTVSNPNTFQITYTLTSGEWDGTNLPGATLVSVNNVDFRDAATGVIDAADKRKLTFTFTLNNGVTFPTNSTIVLGSNAVVGSLSNPATGGFADATAGNGAIVKVYETLQQPALTANYCTPSTREIGVNVKLTNNAGTEFESNFSLAPLDNDTPILLSGVATKTTITASSAFVGAATAKESSRVDVLIGSLGRLFTTQDNSAGLADVTDAQLTSVVGTRTDNAVINLGTIAFSDNQALYDTNGSVIYSVNTGPWNAGVANDGGVAHNGLSTVVTGRFVTGSTVVFNTAADCAVGTALTTTSTYNTGRTQVTLGLAKAALDTVGLTGTSRVLHVCYTVPGTVGSIIPTAQFAVASGTLPRVAASNELATPICPGNLYNLTANGVRVDVRNYIPAIVEGPSGGWKNVVRVINTDEDQPSVDVYGTALLRDGTLGATAVIAAGMKPREVRYLSAATIDAALNAAATATVKTFGADDIPQNARLRITAASSSLRVQNYHFNPATGNYLEASAAQGDEGPDYARARERDNK